MTIVYVQNKDGKPLMPTTRCGHVRRLLKSKLARVVCYKPFTIRLLYECSNKVQLLCIGIDPGRTNIGIAVVTEDGTPVLTAQVKTRNREIPKLMKERNVHRHHHRHDGRRKPRQRRAKKNSTEKAPSFKRILPGCKEPIICNCIKNKEARFNNRHRPEGWLTPTARQLLQTHLNVIRKIAKFMPITDVVLEVNSFDFQIMENPSIKKWQYGRGPLYGKGTLKQAVYDEQEGKCLLCGGSIQHYHHIVPRHEQGSDTFANIVGLCESCHKYVHVSDDAKSELISFKEGLNKRYDALSTLNQIMPFLEKRLIATYPDHVYVTDGYSTALCRKTNGYTKDHHIDAYCIALAAMPNATPITDIHEPVEIQQFRRHDRQACHKENVKRVYLLDGKLIATNRHKAFEQKEPSLADIRATLTNTEISCLTIKPHEAQYKRMNRQMPGSIYLFNGCRYVLKGTRGLHNGIPDYCVAADGSKHPYRKCIFVKNNAGLVLL